MDTSVPPACSRPLSRMRQWMRRPRRRSISSHSLRHRAKRLRVTSGSTRSKVSFHRDFHKLPAAECSHDSIPALNLADEYGIKLKPLPEVTFAKNDLGFHDPTGVDHDALGKGLKKAIYNFMHGNLVEADVRSWFDVRRTSPVKRGKWVLDNILESYPIYPLLALLAILAVGLTLADLVNEGGLSEMDVLA